MIKDLHIRHGLRMAAFFGFFQFIMPVIGWAAGMTFSEYIGAFDHWIAFALLAFVGGRMIYTCLPFSKEDEASECSCGNKKDCRDIPTLFLLSIATSIDAMAVGLSFAMIDVEIIHPSVIIGLITFAVSMVGYYLGKAVGSKIKIELDIVGGVVLIGIGFKILASHLMA
jgi:putative Mn2+ efflux pump MntP